MSLRFIDGFDHVAVADATLKWGAGAPNSVQTGRFGGLCARWSGGSPVVLVKTITATASFVFGFAFRPSTLWSMQPILALRDAGTAQVELRIADASGNLSVTRNGTAVTSGTGTAPLVLGQWHYIEFKVTIADSIGASSCVVRVNGATIITVATSQDLKNTANASANQIALGASANLSTATYDFDDFYFFDSAGSVNNDFVGEMRVETIMPTGAGTTTAWTPSAGANWQCVDEIPPNDDTDYVSSAVVNDVDTYAVANLSTAPVTIAGVQVTLKAAKNDAGARTIAAVTRNSGANTVGAAVTLASTYAIASEISETQPTAGGAWTETAVNAAEFGVKMVS